MLFFELDTSVPLSTLENRPVALGHWISCVQDNVSHELEGINSVKLIYGNPMIIALMQIVELMLGKRHAARQIQSVC